MMRRAPFVISTPHSILFFFIPQGLKLKGPFTHIKGTFFPKIIYEEIPPAISLSPITQFHQISQEQVIFGLNLKFSRNVCQVRDRGVAGRLFCCLLGI